MTIEQSAYPDLGQPQIPPPAVAADQAAAEQEVPVSSLAMKRFELFCAGEGVDVTSESEVNRQHLVTELMRGYVMQSVIREVQQGEAKLLPASTVTGQMVEFYRHNDPTTESPARLRQQQAFRKQHIGIALSQRHGYREIVEANQILRGAIFTGNGLVVYSARDLLTIYGMTIKKHGLMGNIALRQP